MVRQSASTALADVDVRTVGRWSVQWAARYPTRFRVVWVALAALVVVTAVIEPTVLSATSLRAVTALAAVLLLVSLGMQLILQAGQIDLSLGAIVTLAATAVVHFSDAEDARLVSSVAIALLVSAAAGLVNGLLVGVARLSAIIATLATSSIIAGITVVWLGVPPSPSGLVPEKLTSFATASIGPVSVLAVVALVAAVGVAVFLGRSAAGRRFLAVGDKPAAAALLGLRSARYYVGVFLWSSLLYGVGGVLAAGFVRSPDLSLGGQYLFAAISAVALGGTLIHGGTASVASTAAACLFLTVLDQLLASQNVSGGVRVLAQGVILVTAVAAVNVGSTVLVSARRKLRR